MFKSIFSRLVVIMLLMSIWLCGFNIHPVRANGTIYIRADGSIDPSTAPIQRNEDLYTLTDDIVLQSEIDGIVVEKNGILLDGARHKIQGWFGRAGIDLTGRSNVTIENLEINLFLFGIYLKNSSDNSISRNRISMNTGLTPNELSCGIYFSGSKNNNVCRNVVYDNYEGLYFDQSSYNHIIGNNITGNISHDLYFRASSNNNITENSIENDVWNGCYLSECSHNIIARNNVTGSLLRIWDSLNNTISENNLVSNDIELIRSSGNSITGNVFTDGGLIIYSGGNLVEGNIVNDKPLFYVENASGLTIGDAGQVILVSCVEILVENLDLSNTATGVRFLATNNSKITNNNITASSDGVCVYNSSNNIISENNITECDTGVFLTNSHNINVSRNRLIANKNWGIWLTHGSHNNTISGNVITQCGLDGIDIDNSVYNDVVENDVSDSNNGIELVYSSNNTIARNNITNNRYGITFDNSNGNTVLGNSIKARTVQSFGIYLIVSSGNVIAENVLANSGIFIMGYYYWMCHGTIVEGNTVNGRPLVYLEGASNLTVQDAGQVILVNCVNVLVENLSLSNATVGVELLGTRNSTIINNIIADNLFGIYLCGSSNNTLTKNNVKDAIELEDSSRNQIYHNNFVECSRLILTRSPSNFWDNGYPSGGNYWSDHNTPDADKDKIGDLPYEIYENNRDNYPLIYPFECYEPGYVCSPDLTGDGIVNIVDVSKVARAFGCKPGDLNWSPTADMDLNEAINIVDVSKVAKEFGKEWTE